MRVFVAWTAILGCLVLPGAAAAQPGPGSAQPGPASVPPPPASRSWLGVGIRDGFSGVVVSEVIPGSPARDAGLLAGDEIIAVAGKRTPNTTALTSDIGARAAGQQVELQVLRRGQRLRLPVVVDLLPTASEILQLRLGGLAAPPFRLPVVTGASGLLADYRGRVVVLMFWSTWDMQSKALMLPLSRLANALGPRQLQVVGVSADSPATQRKFLATNAVPFTLLHDAAGTTRTRSYRSASVPTLIVIDRGGVVRYAGIGAGTNVDHAVFVAKRAARDR